MVSPQTVFTPGVWFYRSKKKSWKMGSGPESSDQEDKAPWTSWMFNFWGFYRLSTNKKVEVWKQYRLLLSSSGGYFSSSMKKLRQWEFFFLNTEIRKNPEKNHRPVLLILFTMQSCKSYHSLLPGVPCCTMQVVLHWLKLCCRFLAWCLPWWVWLKRGWGRGGGLFTSANRIWNNY